ncbi:hypothetical protein HGP14_02970 [Rhizobium sp. P32RR-XVIII]|uniref:hypothetical protein n=1 Tax=Rhizobium sp. P32RR-XVIII TaxID=2726738 RepID=UPI0014568A40|nr:hypothetical protein [Rhizobium sp. P32RR-XVIII]NLS02332.1 hypothetical protein [Rhizobium sp. P32RR-XVIII]
MIYDPHNWYWLADDGRLYSSARNATISRSDGEYVAWSKKGNVATRWPVDASGDQTEGALQDVLAPYGVYLTLSALKECLKHALDKAAEIERLRCITPGSGQAMEYQQAAAEAGLLLAALAADPGHVPSAADYPMLAASLGIDGETLADVATTVAAMHAQWQAIGSAIRATRLAAKREIDLAQTVGAAKEVAGAVDWPVL